MVFPREVTQYKRQNGPKARTRAARLYSKCFTVPEVELGLAEATVLVAPGGGVSFSTTYISPVASEDTKSRPLLSKAIPTGLKQFCGHTELSTLAKMSVTAVLLSGAAKGSPSWNGMTDSL